MKRLDWAGSRALLSLWQGCAPAKETANGIGVSRFADVDGSQNKTRRNVVGRVEVGF